MTERRKFLRFETALEALCDIASKNIKSPFRVKNISKEGALLVINKKLGEGDEIDMSMDVPGDNVPIFASCQVAWQRGPETGVKFTRINSSDKGRLLEYLYSQWLRLMDKKA